MSPSHCTLLPISDCVRAHRPVDRPLPTTSRRLHHHERVARLQEAQDHRPVSEDEHRLGFLRNLPVVPPTQSPLKNEHSRHLSWGTKAGIRSSGRMWKTVETTAHPALHVGCSPRRTDIECGIRRLRYEGAITKNWRDFCGGPATVAIRRAKTHRMGFMYDCVHYMDSPYDWLLHAPTPQPNLTRIDTQHFHTGYAKSEGNERMRGRQS